MPKRVVSFKIDDKDLKMLDEIRKRRGVSRSKIINELIKELIQKELEIKEWEKRGGKRWIVRILP